MMVLPCSSSIFRTQNASKLGASKLLHLMERQQDDGTLAADLMKGQFHVLVLQCSSVTLKECHETAKLGKSAETVTLL